MKGPKRIADCEKLEIITFGKGCIGSKLFPLIRRILQLAVAGGKQPIHNDEYAKK
jgi:hypothetical protein